ncbi:MAG: tetratricopeptide repeat protein [Myxococcales bacterium]|nr:tetratricopeptide repeat protein [Myxococcales bacterium]
MVNPTSALRRTLTLASILVARAVVAAPPEPEAAPLFQVALEAEAKKDWAAARDAYTRLLTAEPDHGRALVNLGLLEVRQGRAAAGKVHCNKALDLDPEASKVHYCLGLALLAEKDRDGAAKAFERAIALLPGDPAPKLELAHLKREDQRFEEAVQLYREAVRARPDDPALHVHLGYCYKRLKQLDAARVEYEKAVQKDPSSFHGHLDLGWVLAKQGDLEGAERHYREAARLRPKHPDPHYNLGNVFSRTGRPDAAADAYTQAATLAPSDPELHLAAAQALWRVGRVEEAKAQVAATRALKLDPKHTKALATVEALVAKPPPPRREPVLE